MGQLVLLARVLEGDLRLQPVWGHMEAFEAHLGGAGRRRGRGEHTRVNPERLSGNAWNKYSGQSEHLQQWT